MNGGLCHDRRGVSPVFGTIILVVIVGLLAGVGAAMAFSMTDELPETAPMVATSADVDLTVEDGSVSQQELVFTHESGESVPVDRLTVVVDTAGGTQSMSVPRTGAVADGTWTAGERLAVPVETTLACGDTRTVTARIVYSNGRQSYVVSRQSIPVRPDGFSIEGGAVVPSSSYSADVELLGIGFTNGPDGPPIDVELAVHVGTQTYRPWNGNLNDGANPRSHTFTDQAAGAPLAVSAIADPDETYMESRTRNSTDAGGFVAVLRDGDTPPNLAGFGDQDSVSSYVAAYVDENGTMSLADNQAIYLFELSDSTTGPAADYQDAVVLVNLTTTATADEPSGTVDDETALVCEQ
jgi:flagellin-like protein